MKWPHCITLTIWLLSSFAQVHSAPCEPPAEIGLEYTVENPDYASNNNQGIVTWTLAGSTVFSTDTSIRQPDIVQSVLIPPDRGIVLKTLPLSFDGLTIAQKFDDNAPVFSCELQVYKRPATPTCQPWTSQGNEVSTTCQTEEVYPEGKCRFTIGSDTAIPTAINQQSTTNPEYYSTSCNPSIDVAGMQEGVHTVTATMWPDLGGLTPGNAGSSLNTTFSLSLPKVNTVSCFQEANFKDGYLLNGTTASCTCALLTPGVPQGTAQWRPVNVPGSSIAIDEPGAPGEQTTITISNAGQFRCEGASVLQGPYDTLERNVKVAWVPSENRNFANITTKTPVYQNENLKQPVTCLVEQDSFDPAPLFTLIANEGILAENQTGDNTEWQISSDLSVNQSGENTVTCIVKSPIFPERGTQETSLTVQIYELPASGPTLQLWQGEDMKTPLEEETWIPQDSLWSVQCTAPGQEGLVESTSITCGSQSTNTSSGNTATLSVVRFSEDILCTCQAVHMVKDPETWEKPQLSANGTVKVAYGPKSVTVSRTGGDNPINLCPNSDVSAVIECSVKKTDVAPNGVDDDPLFNLAISSNGGLTQGSGSSGDTDDFFKHVYNLQARSGGEYSITCGAKNSKFASLNNTSEPLTLTVREPPTYRPTFPTSDTQPKNNEVVVDQIVTLTCSVSGGFPPVSHVNISCAGSVGESVRVEGTSASLVLNITEDYNNSVCTCRAEHLTGCYDLTSEYKLHVVEKNQVPAHPNSDTESDSDGMSVAVYVIIAAVVMVIVITVIVLIVLRRKGWRLGLRLYRKDLKKDKLYSTPTQQSPEQPQQQQQQELQQQELQQQQQQQERQQQKQHQPQRLLPLRPISNTYDTIPEPPKQGYTRVDLSPGDGHKYEDLALSDLGQPIVTSPPGHEVPRHDETRDDVPCDALSRNGEPRGPLSLDGEPRGGMSSNGEPPDGEPRYRVPHGAISHDREPRYRVPRGAFSHDGEPHGEMSRDGEPLDGMSHQRQIPQPSQLQQQGPVTNTYDKIPDYQREEMEVSSKSQDSNPNPREPEQAIRRPTPPSARNEWPVYVNEDMPYENTQPRHIMPESDYENPLQ